MFFFFSKILGFILNPLFWILVLLVWGVLTKKQKRTKRLIIASLVLFLVLGNSFIINEIGIATEKKWRDSVKKLDQYPDTAVLLGGFCFFDEDLKRIEFAEAADRFYQVLKLYQSHKINTLIVSGGSGSILYPEEKEAPLVLAYLKEGGFRNDNLIIESESRNTYENAILTKELISTNNPNVLLVTSAFHMNRAIKVFRKAGFDPIPYPTHFLFEPTRKYNISTYIIPTSRSFYRWEFLIKEWLGTLMYKIKGYL